MSKPNKVNRGITLPNGKKLPIKTQQKDKPREDLRGYIPSSPKWMDYAHTSNYL